LVPIHRCIRVAEPLSPLHAGTAYAAFPLDARLSRQTLAGVEYIFSNQKLPFDDARKMCNYMGAELAVISSATENEQMYKAATTDFLPAKDVLGLGDGERCRGQAAARCWW
jgi:hypothetical protein